MTANEQPLSEFDYTMATDYLRGVIQFEENTVALKDGGRCTVSALQMQRWQDAARAIEAEADTHIANTHGLDF